MADKNKQLSALDKEMIFNVAGEEVKLTANIVNQFIAKDKPLTQQEAVNFMQLCKYRKLNPFVNEAYPIKFGNEPATFVVGADAFKRRAEENPNFKGFEAGIIIQRDKEILELEGEFKLPNDILLGGWAKVYTQDKEKPYVSKVSMAEYGKNQSTWKSIPCTMIRKVALVHALREAFPNDLGSLYIEDEMNSKFSSKGSPVAQESKSQLEKELEEEGVIQEAEFEEVKDER